MERRFPDKGITKPKPKNGGAIAAFTIISILIIGGCIFFGLRYFNEKEDTIPPNKEKLAASTLITKKKGKFVFRKECENNLVHLGFSLSQKGVGKLPFYDYDQDYQREVKPGRYRTFSKDGVTVKLSYYDTDKNSPAIIEIDFPDEEQKDNFIKTLSQYGYKEEEGLTLIHLENLTVDSRGTHVSLAAM